MTKETENAAEEVVTYPDVWALLSAIQQSLHVPKAQRNNFGNYNYRSCEDVLDAVKKALPVGAVIMLHDSVELIGQRFYIKATARLTYQGATIENQAFAREEDVRKGMDGSQITGAASSYARKYALNGLFAIDDTKDSDATNKHGKDGDSENPKQEKKKGEKNTQYEPNYTADEIIENLSKAMTIDAFEKAKEHMKQDINFYMKSAPDDFSRIAAGAGKIKERLAVSGVKKHESAPIDDEIPFT